MHKILRKAAVLTAALSFLLSGIPASAENRIHMPVHVSGLIDAGELNGVKWEFSDDYKMTIEVTGGVMENYPVNSAPWVSYMPEIKAVEFKEGCVHIGSYAFFGATGLESVTFPETLKEIGEGAFSKCISLETVQFQDELYRIDTSAFAMDTSLKSVTFGSKLGIISDVAFSGCISLREAEFPEHLQEIGQLAFNNTRLHWVVLPYYLKKLGSGAFMNNPELEKIWINTVFLKEVPEQCFYNCKTLNQCSLNLGYEKIAKNAFYGVSEEGTFVYSCPVEYDALVIEEGNEVLSGWANSFWEPEVQFAWTADGTHANMMLVCPKHGIVADVEAVVYLESETEPTCTADGEKKYAAVATYRGTTVSGYKTLTVEAKGHDFEKPVYTWSKDNKKVTAAAKCKECGEELKETVNTTYAVTKKPAVGKDGTGTYTAVFTDPVFKKQTKTITLLKLLEMHRLYNPNSGEHFYTAKTAEKDFLVKNGWNYEGIGWIAPEKSNTPVYRLYNANSGDHHYTMKVKERDALIKAGWKDEKIGWYSDDAKGVPLYREYNPNMAACNHNYTTKKAEHDYLTSHGWNDEGIGWYGVK